LQRQGHRRRPIGYTQLGEDVADVGLARAATAEVIMQAASVSTIQGGTVIRTVSLSQSADRAPQPPHLHGDQVNPRATGDSGYSAFFIASGFYHQQVGAVDGYQWWPSPVVQVISEGVHVNAANAMAKRRG